MLSRELLYGFILRSARAFVALPGVMDGNTVTPISRELFPFLFASCLLVGSYKRELIGGAIIRLPVCVFVYAAVLIYRSGSS